MIEFACPACGGAVRAPDQFAGKYGTCHHCKAVVPIPRVDALAQLAPEERSKVYEMFLDDPLAKTPPRPMPAVKQRTAGRVRAVSAQPPRRDPGAWPLVAVISAAVAVTAVAFALTRQPSEPVVVEATQPTPKAPEPRAVVVLPPPVDEPAPAVEEPAPRPAPVPEPVVHERDVEPETSTEEESDPEPAVVEPVVPAPVTEVTPAPVPAAPVGQDDEPEADAGSPAPPRRPRPQRPDPEPRPRRTALDRLIEARVSVAGPVRAFVFNTCDTSPVARKDNALLRPGAAGFMQEVSDLATVDHIAIVRFLPLADAPFGIGYRVAQGAWCLESERGSNEFAIRAGDGTEWRWPFRRGEWNTAEFRVHVDNAATLARTLNIVVNGELVAPPGATGNLGFNGRVSGLYVYTSETTDAQPGGISTVVIANGGVEVRGPIPQPRR